MMPMERGSDMNMKNSSSMENIVMHMTFYWGKDVLVLFSGWPKDSIGMYVLALLFVFALAAGVEILSVSPKARLISSNHKSVALVEACVYAVRMSLAYMVMLSVMSYNLGIFVAAVVGHSVAFFFIRVRDLAAANPPESDPKV